MVSCTDPTASRPPATEPRRESIGRLLALTAKAVRELFDARLASRGGSLPTWIVLTQAIDQRRRARASASWPPAWASAGPPSSATSTGSRRDGLVVRRRDRARPPGHPHRHHAGRSTPPSPSWRSSPTELDREVKALMSDEEEQVLRSVLQRLGDHALAAPRPAGPDRRSPRPPRLTDPTDETDVA